MSDVTATEQAAPLSPLDEPWMRRALLYVLITRERTGVSPTWAELWSFMGWNRKRAAPWFKMRRLAKRGLVWEAEVPRSLRLSEAGLAQLKATQRASMRAAGKRRAEKASAA